MDVVGASQFIALDPPDVPASHNHHVVEDFDVIVLEWHYDSEGSNIEALVVEHRSQILFSSKGNIEALVDHRFQILFARRGVLCYCFLLYPFHQLEPLGGAHTDPTWTSQQIKLAVTKAMKHSGVVPVWGLHRSV
ncbi:hypothetical protein M5K25_027289 [Dendrobium thyrsiflorum]|uniref:Uncharacterized protein n=1 Tax=Dendrobium thyrsiflorum TaxID=117978 RepID=A0ABD0TZF5_DENTH